MKIKNKYKIFFMSVVIICGIYFINSSEIEKIKSKNLENLKFFKVFKEGSFIFSTLERTYIVDKTEEIKVEKYIYSVVGTTEKYYIYRGDNKKLGFLDEKLQEITESKFDFISELDKSNFFIVTLDGKQYLFDIKKERIVQEVDFVTLEDNYLKIVKDDNISLVDQEGNELIPPLYDNILYVKEELAVVSKNKKFGVVDLNNKEILPFKYDEIYFSNGNFLAKKDEKYYLNNESLDIEKIYPSKNDVLISDLNVGFSLLDLKNKKISKNVYDEISPVYNDYMIVAKENKYAVIDKYEKLKPRYIYDYILFLGDNSYMAGTDEKGKFCLIVDGKSVTAEKYENIIRISKNFYLGKLANGVQVLLDKKGRERLKVLEKDIVYYDTEVFIVKDREKDDEYYIEVLEK